MAGVKGMKGGGGYRPGSGRKKKVVPPIVTENVSDPKEFLRSVMNDNAADPRLRVDAAKTLMAYEHQRPGAIGKKVEKMKAAARVSAGKFAPTAPPKLVAVS